ncbi:MAG TPA: ATP-binding protein, partial [Tenuifilaceae bacterium]|nr:ATP-binding protein [Tenuifilaceae bacterium]
SIGNIFEKSKESKLNPSLFPDIENDLSYIADYFSSSKREAFLIAHIFTLNYKGDTVDVKDLVEYFDCNPVKLLDFSDEFESLWKKGIINRERSRHRPSVFLSNDQFTVDERITMAILQGKSIPKLKTDKIENFMDLLERVEKMVDAKRDQETPCRLLIIEVSNLLKRYKNFPVINRIKGIGLSREDLFLFINLVWKSLNGFDSIQLSTPVENMFDRASDRISYIQQIISGNNPLVKQNLLEVIEATFFSETEIRITDFAATILQEEGVTLYIKKPKNGNILAPDQIQPKELFFNEADRMQLNMLYKLLEDSNTKRVRERLLEKNLPTGVTVLLFGSPGTGKTETVYQVAKATNREILKVDISQSKSFWFGESEKVIKRIFSDYYQYSKDKQVTPILFFNEADAIISKRKDVTKSSVGQTENAIQNIILEELENFTGIFIATTNLITNIDEAFDRRFLFKIELQKPDVSAKTKIWQSKLPSLSPMHCKTLAESFDLSGGQIDNVVRKSEMEEVIHGSSPSLERIIELCKAEHLSRSNAKRIGF